jgi:hypothetical protein
MMVVKHKVPAVFIKLDILKAFDTVSWSYLLDIMKHLGFGARWREWIAALWATSSSSFLVNGVPGQKICHRRRVRQDDCDRTTSKIRDLSPKIISGDSR